MIDFSNSVFIKSATKKSERPSSDLNEVLIVGKSNVGKSSLINALCQRKRLAYTSSKPGHTRLLNYFNIANKFFLVDAPGYGYARGGVDLDRIFGEMMEDYFTDNEYLKLVLLLVDSRREFSTNDLEIVDYVKENKIPFFIVFTKVDKINQKEKAALLKYLKENKINFTNCFFTSSLVKTKGLAPLKAAIEKQL